MKYTAADGTEFTDDDIERWATEAEAGFPGAVFAPTVHGPWGDDEDGSPLVLRLDPAHLAKLLKTANDRETTMTQVVEDLIDSL